MELTEASLEGNSLRCFIPSLLPGAGSLSSRGFSQDWGQRQSGRSAPAPSPGTWRGDELLGSVQSQSSERRGGRRSLTWASPTGGARKDARRPRGNRTRESPPELSRSAEVMCKALLRAEVPRGRGRGEEGREGRGGPRTSRGACLRAGTGMCRASVYFRGRLCNRVSTPRGRRPLPTPILAVAVPGWLSVRAHLFCSAPEPFTPRGWGWTSWASRPGRGSRRPRPGAGLAGSLPPAAPLLLLLLPPPQPHVADLLPGAFRPAGPHTDAAAAPRRPRAPGNHAAAWARDTAGCEGWPGASE